MPQLLRTLFKRGLIRLTLGLLGTLMLVYAIAWVLPPPAIFGTRPQSLMVLDRTGVLLRFETAQDGIFRLDTPLESIPPTLIEATLNYEDQYFYQHPGVNPWALIKGAVASVLHRPIGASTITMQVARMALHLHTRSLWGKLKQIWWAWRIEVHYSKAQILEAYFNLAPYGGNIEGAQAASLLYYQKEVKDLTPLEALTLSVIPQNPGRRHPWVGDDFTRAVQHRLWDPRFPMPEPVKVFEAQHLSRLTPKRLPFLAPHFVEHVKRQETIGLPLSPTQPPLTGRITTTLDLRLHQALSTSFRESLSRLMRQGIANGGFMVVDGETGEILSYQGSRDFLDPRFPGQVDGLKGLRNPGSTLKPFIYGIAAESGHLHSHTLLWDLPRQYPGWRPQNADGTFLGPLPAWQALVLSRNPPAISLYQEEGPLLLERLEALGIPLFEDKSKYGLSVALGGVSLRPVDVAYLYTALTHDGVPTPLISHGQPVALTPHALPHPLYQGEGLLSPGAAQLVRAMMEKGDATLDMDEDTPLPLALKTGTSQGRQDAWTVGTVGPYVLLVWLGDPTPTSHEGLTGFEAARPTWLSLAKTLFLQKRDTIVKRPTKRDRLMSRDVCPDTGDVTPNWEGVPLCSHPEKALFIPGQTRFEDTGLRAWAALTEEGTLGCEDQGAWTQVAVYPEDLARLTLEATGVNINRQVKPGCQAPLLRTDRPPRGTLVASTSTESPLASSSKVSPEDLDPEMPRFMARPARVLPQHDSPSPEDALRITGPTPGTRLVVARGQQTVMVRLEAVSQAAGELIWFEGSLVLGTVSNGKPLDVPLSAGPHKLSVMDSLGHKKSVTIQIESTTPWTGLK